MPHALRVYKMLKNSGMPEDRALCIAGVVEQARDGDGLFRRDELIDKIFDAGVGEEQAEVLIDVLQNAFVTQKFRTHFDRTNLKVELVRSGQTAAFADALLDAVDPCVVTPRTAEVRLPLKYPPGPGRVVMCDFTHLKKPEMQKERRAIVVSTRAASAVGRCTVVPVSAKRSQKPNTHHYEFAAGSYDFFHSTEPVWAVCDHVYTVSLDRLWAVNLGLKPQVNIRISEAHFQGVLALLGTGLGLIR